ncbi:putative reverse transcriptase domain-containing protein [Tanacetum coccineum]|uniref:Reverse transcriptase domain-containing protein n=1 Tax=Tanacetum coccineum TaxID=301880 RepID=A0ABQ4YTQ3_9ASTR
MDRYVSNCAITNQVKFASCTLQGSALTWWNSHVRAVGQDVAYTMPWTALKRMITDKYCPRGEIKKLESEYWNLKVRGTDLMTYNQRFQELALMCDRMFPEESAKVERYVGGLPDMIHGSVKASKPQSMQEAIEFATEMMDKKMITAAERQAENKRKFEETPRNTQNQQQPFKRNNVARAYTAGPGDKKPYGGTKPLCAKCNYHHDGPCTLKCTNCKKTGHSARDCKVRPTANYNNNNNNNNQRTQGTNPRVITCFECGVQGHYSQAGNAKAQAKVYAVGNAGANPDNNVVTSTFLLNNRYASILFDTGADRSFVSTAFYSRIVITIRRALDHRIGGKQPKTRQVKEIRLEDVPVVQDFPEVFLKTCRHGHQYRLATIRNEGTSEAIYRNLRTKADKNQFPHPWGAPVLCVKKKDGSFRCASIKGIEQTDRKEPLPTIPRIDDLFETSRVRASIYQGSSESVSPVEVREEEHSQDCIQDRYGHYEFQVMSFGLTNATGPYNSRHVELTSSAPILALPEGSKDFIAYCDASKKV